MVYPISIEEGEAELERREEQLEEAGPEHFGLERCPDCSAWFEAPNDLESHRREIHSLDGTVAAELSVPRSRVNAVSNASDACQR